MYSEEYEDPLYRKLSKVLELTSLIFGHYKNTGQKREGSWFNSVGGLSLTSCNRA